MLDLSLYLVASRGNLSDESFLNILNEALKGGVSIVQLREKNLCTRDFYALALKVKALCATFKVPFLINDRIDIAMAIKADGVHLGQDDMPVNIARKMLGVDKIIGLSVQKLSQLENTAGADYLGCGAVFQTTTKESKVINPAGLKALCDNSALPVVAIGGINLENIAQLKGIKLAGIAVVSAIMNAKEPLKAALKLKESFKNL